MSPGRMHRVLLQLRRAAERSDAGERPDAELLRSFIEARDETAFTALVRRHAAMVLGVCRRVTGDAHDAEDAFQAAFCVLLRKAASIRRREVLGSWLYGVAYRTSLAAKVRRAKTRRREHQVDAMPQPTTMPPEDNHDWQPLLDAALERLPEGYRVPIVLCDLEGKSRKEAALQLHLSEGTLSSRLARGRRLLAQRLQRQGLTLSGGALAALLAQQAATAHVPVALVHSVSQVGVQMLLGAAPAALAVSRSVLALTEGVMKAMLLGKLKSCMVILLTCAALTVGGLWWTGHGAAQTPAADPTAAPAPAPPLAKQSATVLDPAHAMQNCTSCHLATHHAFQRNPHGTAGLPEFKIDAVLTLNDGINKAKPVAMPSATTALGQRVSFGMEGFLDQQANPPRPYKFSWTVEVSRQRGNDVLVSVTLEKKERRTNALVRGQSLEFEDFVALSTWKEISDSTWPGADMVFKIKVSPAVVAPQPLPLPPKQSTLKPGGSASDPFAAPPANAPPQTGSATAISPDGTRLAVTGKDDVVIIDVRTGKILSRTVAAETVHALAFSPDGKLLASGSAQGIVQLYDAATGKVVRQIKNDRPILRIEFAVDGTTRISVIVGTTDDPALRVWDSTTGKLLRVEPAPPPERGKAKEAPAPKEGKIESIHSDDANLVQISIGSEQGLKQNDALEVHRLDPPMYLGQIRIVDVTPQQAVGRLERFGRGKVQLRVGDRVTTSLARN